MRSSTPRVDGDGAEALAAVCLDDTDGWIFDLDGVLTDTASLHLRAWTEVFQEFFASVAADGLTAAPAAFTDDDYRALVDGEDRMDGVRNVLADRHIPLPEGGPDDPAGSRTVSGLAKEKDARYLALLAELGPRPFASSAELLRRLREAGVGVAVVSASRHCAQVLEAAGLTALVDVRVDGETARAMALAGKPDPALFLEAARRLGVEPSRAVVVEDALAGVEAGRRGEFGVVVGVDRDARGDALRHSGADIVVTDLGELTVTGRGPRQSPWWLTYDDPDRVDEGVVETLCTLGNGYLGTRGRGRGRTTTAPPIPAPTWPGSTTDSRARCSAISSKWRASSMRPIGCRSPSVPMTGRGSAPRGRSCRRIGSASTCAAGSWSAIAWSPTVPVGARRWSRGGWCRWPTPTSSPWS